MNSASELISQLTDTYAARSSYRDEGDIVTVYIDTDPPRRRTRTELFETSFVRPSHFRYLQKEQEKDSDSEWRLRAIWRSARVSNTFCSYQQIREQHESLGMAIASLGGPGVTVANLLLGKEVGAFCLTDLVEMHMGGREDIDGHSCFRITGRHPRGGANTLWIDADSLLLRRRLEIDTIQPSSEEAQLANFELATKDFDPRVKELWRQRGVPPIQRHPFQVETTTRYKPDSNSAIDMSIFDFIPPDPPPERPRRRWFPPRNLTN